MAKNCPNCLHPVRTGANYCGYCGSSLVPTPQDPSPTTRSTSKEKMHKSTKSSKALRHSKGGRSWIKIPISLLVMVILLALAVRFWPEILLFLSQTLPRIAIS